MSGTEIKEAQWKMLAKTALDVQDASNLSGVIHTWAKVMAGLNELGLDNKERDMHPITMMFLSKVTSLMRAECDGIGGVDIGPRTHTQTDVIYGHRLDFVWAYDECKRLAGVPS